MDNINNGAKDGNVHDAPEWLAVRCLVWTVFQDG